MVNRTKKLQGYINILPILGTLFVVGSLIFVIGVSSSRNPENWMQYYFHFKVLGVILGYLWESYWNPGGRVTINFDKSAFSEDEKSLDQLVIKYKSDLLMAIPPVLFIVATF